MTPTLIRTVESFLCVYIKYKLSFSLCFFFVIELASLLPQWSHSFFHLLHLSFSHTPSKFPLFLFTIVTTHSHVTIRMVDHQTVCCMCGDVGFLDKLFRCNKCNHRFQHSYVSLSLISFFLFDLHHINIHVIIHKWYMYIFSCRIKYKQKIK